MKGEFTMGVLLLLSLCLMGLQMKLILRQHSYICKLVGARAELKEENRRLRKEVEGIVLKVM